MTKITASLPPQPPKALRLVLYDYAYESFAIQYLASVLKWHGYPLHVHYDVSMHLDYLDEDLPFASYLSMTPEQTAREIAALRPDVVGFSLITVFFSKLLEIIRHLKRLLPDVVVIAGGPHCNLAPEETLETPEIDFIFLGDADISLPDFLEKLERLGSEAVKALPVEAMPGIANRHGGATVLRGIGPLMEDLDQVPFPEKDDYYRVNPALASMYTITCSRGCAYRCTYCNSNNLRRMYNSCGQRYYRMRSVPNVIAELKMAKKKYKPHSIMFLDSLFAGKKAWLEEFAGAYAREINLPYFCETNPNVHDARTIDLLAQSGCTLLQFGFQSANEDVRHNILHRKESNARLIELVRRAKQHGIFVCVDHIANLPGEQKSHLEEAVRFYAMLRPNWVNLGFLQFYPKAEIIEIALARRVIRPEDVPAINRGEYQHSFRLVSKSDLSEYYVTLPMRFFAAFKLPRWLGSRVDAAMDNPRLARLLAPLGSVFIYASRIVCAFTDRRDFLVRHHVQRNLRVVAILLKKKVMSHG